LSGRKGKKRQHGEAWSNLRPVEGMGEMEELSTNSYQADRHVGIGRENSVSRQFLRVVKRVGGEADFGDVLSVNL